MQVQAINNQQYKNTFTSKVIIPPNAASELARFMEINPSGAKSIKSGIKVLENNGNNDVVVIDRYQTREHDNFVLFVYSKIKNKVYRNNYPQPMDISLYDFKVNVEQCYNRAKVNQVPVNRIELYGFEQFHPFRISKPKIRKKHV